MSKSETLLKKYGENITQSTSASLEALTSSIEQEQLAPHQKRMRDREAAYVRVADLIPDPAQPRKTMDPEKLERLANSMKAQGQLQPIRVRWSQEQDKFVIISGERRWRAAQKIGLEKLACQIVEGVLGEDTKTAQQIIENLHREDVPPMAVAQSYQSLIETHGWTQKKVADELGVTQAEVSRYLALLELDPQVQQKIREEVISPSVASPLSRLPKSEQRKMATTIIRKGLSRDDVTAAVQQKVGRRNHKASKQGKRMVCRLSDGTSVTIGHSTEVLTLERFIEALEQVLHQARIARENKVPLDDVPSRLKVAGRTE